MDQTDRDESWAFAQGKEGAWLLHAASGTVGRVERVFAPGEYIPAVVGAGESTASLRGPLEATVTVAVVQFEDGDAFLADPANFTALTEHDVLLFEVLQERVRELVGGLSAMAARDSKVTGSTPATTAAVLRAVLQSQLRALAPR